MLVSVHRFRFDKLLSFAGNDLIAISSLDGASDDMQILAILKAGSRFYIRASL